MPCTLRAAGTKFDVASFLNATALPILHSYRRGEPWNRAGDEIGLYSGVVVRVSEARFTDIDQQIEDAMRFVDDYASEIRALVRTPGVETCVLDFGVAPGEDIVMHEAHFTVAFLERLVHLKLTLVVSSYVAEGLR